MGGTKTAGVLLDPAGNIQARERIPTEARKGYARILENVAAVYESLASAARKSPHGVGICTPGAIARDGTQITGNPPCLNGKAFKQDLEQRIGRSVAVENDANCFALAEAIRGAARGKDLVFGATIGTGCGGGIVFKGQLLSGSQGRAGEWGHMTLDPKGPRCSCGKRGCVQALISGSGVKKRYEAAFGREGRMQDIEKDYRRGEPATVAFLGEFFRNFGMAMANVVAVLDPDIIVLGGGVSNIEALYTEGLQALRDGLVPYAKAPPLVRSELGDAAGAIGAALL